MERDEEAIVGWRREVWPRVKHSRGNGGWICFLDESGQSLGPPKGRTWAPIGQTPIVQVSGKGGGRVLLAGWSASNPGSAPG